MSESAGAGAGAGGSAEAASRAVDETNSLLPRLRLIEDQPLEARAAAFSQLHDELQSRLDAGDGSRLHG